MTAAFPSPGIVGPDGYQQGAYAGMSYRQYLMAHAPMVPQEFPWKIIAKVIESHGRRSMGSVDEPIEQRQARWAVAYADAILKVQE